MNTASTYGELAHPWVSRLGRYEPGRPIEEVARELGFASLDEIVKLASNENALGPSPLAVKAMKKAARAMHLYPDGDVFHLKQALAKRLGVAPGQLLFGNGSNELVELIGHVFLGPGTGIVMASRAFVVYRLIAAMFQSEVVDAPMREFTHDLEAMLKAVKPNTKIVFVSNPNNPTSTMVDGAAIGRFMERVPDRVIVCFDEAYIELLPPERQPDVLSYVRQGRKVIVLRTFSKTYGLAGLRLGYAVAAEECVALLNRIRQPFNVNAMAQAAALAALGDEAYVRRTRGMVASGIRYLEREFRRMGLRYVPASVNFILVEVGRGRDVFVELQKLGVIVRPMDGYGLPSHVRVTIGKAAENRKCIECLKRVLAKDRGGPRAEQSVKP